MLWPTLYLCNICHDRSFYSAQSMYNIEHFNVCWIGECIIFEVLAAP